MKQRGPVTWSPVQVTLRKGQGEAMHHLQGSLGAAPPRTTRLGSRSPPGDAMGVEALQPLPRLWILPDGTWGPCEKTYESPRTSMSSV